ncbi:MAG: hypothetical protein AAGF24_01320 [Cyanobacteria bacterium P01_H01_bin.121]
MANTIAAVQGPDLLTELDNPPFPDGVKLQLKAQMESLQALQTAKAALEAQEQEIRDRFFATLQEHQVVAVNLGGQVPNLRTRTRTSYAYSDAVKGKESELKKLKREEQESGAATATTSTTTYLDIRDLGNYLQFAGA